VLPDVIVIITIIIIIAIIVIIRIPFRTMNHTGKDQRWALDRMLVGDTLFCFNTSLE
jgi:hypothetical protein